MIELVSQQRFHGVGQGLFVSGSVDTRMILESPVWHRRPFHWVYDCGSISKPSALTDQIQSLQNAHNVQQDIDLLFISHFDNDHINGLPELLSRHRVRTLVLPYAPLWKRLLIGFASGLEPENPAFEFLVRPVEYIHATAPGRVDRVLFVPPSPGAPSGQTLELLTDDTPFDAFDGSGIDDYLMGYLRDDSEEVAFLALGGSLGPSVGLLPPGDTLSVKGMWEFLPYNDPARAPKGGAGFREQVASCRARLITDPQRTWDILRELKGGYGANFGKGSKKRNLISLFLFAAPLLNGRMIPLPRPTYEIKSTLESADGTRKLRSNIKTTHHWYDITCLVDEHSLDSWLPGYLKEGTLLCGDGFLRMAELDRLSNFLRPNHRSSRIHTFQVMHHGSRHNWYGGNTKLGRRSVANTFQPELSVFSSQPDWNDRHPDADVLRDFHQFGPTQVDDVNTLIIDQSAMFR